MWNDAIIYPMRCFAKNLSGCFGHFSEQDSIRFDEDRIIVDEKILTGKTGRSQKGNQIFPA